MVQHRGDRRREDRARAHTDPQEGGRHGHRGVPSQQGDSVAPAAGLPEALAALLAARGGAGLDEDPIRFPRRFRRRLDAEAAAFLAATFAFGNVAQIRAFLTKLFAALSPSPHAVLAGPGSLPARGVAGLAYRFISPEGVRRVLLALRAAYRAKGSLESLYAETPPGAGPRERLSRFLAWFRARWGKGLPRERNFLFPDPALGSACKRHNLFLRWMVRRDDGVDLGLWDSVPAADLIVPLDTHMARMAGWLGLTERRAADWKTAEEVTAAFRSVCPGDPVRFDFALTRLGILKECTSKRRGACGRCALSRVCLRSAKPGRLMLPSFPLVG